MYKEQYQSLTSKARNNFVVKVYSIVGIQLLITSIAVGLNMIYPAIAKFQATYASVMWLSLIGAIVSMLVLSFSQTHSKTFPLNMGWLGLFTLCESYLVSVITSIYTPESVLLAAVATVAATLGITFYAMTSKSDFTDFSNSITAFGFALFNIIFWVSLVNIFFVRSPFMNLLISWAMGIVYTIYLLVDTQLIMGGKRNSLSLDNYAMGAMIIYTDVIQLFLKILRILGKKKDD